MIYVVAIYVFLPVFFCVFRVIIIKECFVSILHHCAIIIATCL